MMITSGLKRWQGKTKKIDKQRDKEDDELSALCFDLEEVLLTPQSRANAMYYKRRLCTNNITIYEYGNNDGFLYIWNESIERRAACEKASWHMCMISWS